jgi:hypothetical protein
VLGQLDGFFYIGEFVQAGRWLADRGPCGCGELIADCPTWRAIFAAAFPESGGIPDPSWFQFDPAETRARGVLRQRLRARGLLPASPGLELNRAAVGAVLRGIGETAGGRVVVDSSKGPGYANVLQATEDVELFVVHLVRDPRAVAHSRLRTAERLGHALGLTPPVFALLWDLWNVVIEVAWRRGRYLRLRYEDFVTRPRQAVEQITALLHERPTRLPLVSEDTVALTPTHTVAGNRSRFQTGEVRLRLDDDWVSANRLPVVDRRAVAALTWPLRVRYGYIGRGGVPASR